MGQEFPSLLAARHRGLEGYRGRGTPLAEAVGLARMARQWCRVQKEESRWVNPYSTVALVLGAWVIVGAVVLGAFL